MDVVTYETKADLARAAAQRIATRAAAGPMTLGLAGGSTPAATYQELGTHDLDWSGITLWLSDERWVPHDHAESNGRMALENLLGEAEARLLRPRHSAFLEPEDSAAHYDATLRSIHDSGVADVVLLGLGTDGHTASLFPGTAALDADPARWFVANHVPQLDTWRLTVTPSLLHAARTVIVLVSGADKAGVLAESVEGPDGRHPFQLLGTATGEVTILADADAASALSG